MIERRRLKKNTKNAEWISKARVYTIESLVDEETLYAATKEQFCIMRDKDAMVCDIEEMPKMAEKFIETIKREILDIYEDLKYLRRAHVEYYEFKSKAGRKAR